MHTEWLRSFLAVVDDGSFGAAAETLFRAQSRVSAHIASLEAEVGVQLFDRKKRPIALTAAGNAFLPYAKAVDEAVEAGKSAAVSAYNDISGQVALGVFPSAGAMFIPEVIRRFRVRCPAVHLELSEHAISGLDAALSHNTETMA
jgi:DNA-binding transcriptional LysR family regulator